MQQLTGYPLLLPVAPGNQLAVQFQQLLHALTQHFDRRMRISQCLIHRLTALQIQSADCFPVATLQCITQGALGLLKLQNDSITHGAPLCFYPILCQGEVHWSPLPSATARLQAAMASQPSFTSRNKPDTSSRMAGSFLTLASIKRRVI